MGSVAIVIPTWNRRGLLAKVLGDLGRQTYPIERVIVVDNGSSDDSAAMAEGAGAEVIRLGTNRGFAAAVNRGIERATSEWIAVLNNDVSLEPDWLERLLAAQSSDAWFMTGKLLNAGAREQIDGTFDAVCRGGCAWRCGHDRPDSPVWNQPRKIQLAPFTAAVFRSDLFRRAGLLDETFESYLEDVDFGLRCAALGLNGWYVPGAVAYHAGSATLGQWHPETVRRISRNQLLLVAKHYPPDWIKRYGWPILVAQVLWGILTLTHGAFLAHLAGVIEGMRRFHGLRHHSAEFPAIIEESEKEILELQRATGFDVFWRLYFALT